jgi:hypothetical protein
MAAAGSDGTFFFPMVPDRMGDAEALAKMVWATSSYPQETWDSEPLVTHGDNAPSL